MKRKLFTLLAAVALFAGGTANATVIKSAEISPAYKSGGSYLLGNGDNFLSVDGESATPGIILIPGTDINDLESVRNALWKVTVTPGENGSTPKFQYVNVATGLILTASYSEAVLKNDADYESSLPISGGLSIWNNGYATQGIEGPSPLFSYFSGDSVAYFSTNGTSLAIVKGLVNEAIADAAILKVQPYTSPIITLTAEELNKTFEDPNNQGYFKLTFPVGVNGQLGNKFADTPLTASEVTTAADYVNLKGLNKDYIVVDTSYIDGTENDGKLLTFAYAKLADEKRVPGSFNFKFEYSASYDSIAISVKEYIHKQASADETGSFWPKTSQTVTDANYLRLATLTGRREITLGDPDLYPTVRILPFNITSTLTPTTLEAGVYTIKYWTKKEDKKLNGAYFVADLQGITYGYRLAENQDFDYIPSAQWVVEKNGTTNQSTVTITNREFDDEYTTGPIQLYEVGEGKFISPAFKKSYTYSEYDTISFVPVEASSLKNKTLGYYTSSLSNDALKAKKFKFNYLTAYNENVYLTVPVDKDSTVTASASDQAYFQLERETTAEKYGFQSDEKAFPNLVRDIYYIKVSDPNKVNNNNRYIAYDYDLQRFVTTSEDDKAIAFYLKTYYKADKLYYALIPAEDEGGYNITSQVKSISLDDWSVNYAYRKVSVNDANGYLNSGSLLQEFDLNFESRVSGFAVEEDTRELYRRFNNKALNETNGDDTADTLIFFRANEPSDVLYENAHKLTGEYGKADSSINYLGARNISLLEGVNIKRSFSFLVDTAYVNRGTGTLKPQYLISVRSNTVPDGDIECGPCGETYKKGYTHGWYLVNATDSARVDGSDKNSEIKNTDYIWNTKWERLAFVEAVRRGDSLYVLNGYKITPDKDGYIDLDDLIADSKKTNGKVEIVNLANNIHKDVVWQFRLVDEGAEKNFLIESENNTLGAKAPAGNGTIIAPFQGGWVKIQNGVAVISRGAYDDAITEAEIFNVKTSSDAPVSNENITTTDVTVVAGAGNVTIYNAAGKQVVISNILGQSVANTVITSDAQTISAPKGVVVVAIQGEKAVKAVVK